MQCGQWSKDGIKFTGHRYGVCPRAQPGFKATHCPHSCGDDDEWCCDCVDNVVLERDLEGYKLAGYPNFEEDILPAPLDDGLCELGITIDNSAYTRAKGRGSILVQGASMFEAWLTEIESRQSKVV